LGRRPPVRAGLVFAGDAEAIEAAENDVVAAVWKLFAMRDQSAAPDAVHRRPPFIVGFPPFAEQRHPDHAVGCERVGHHLAVPRLEDVERQKDPGEKHHGGKRKQRQEIGHSKLLMAKC